MYSSLVIAFGIIFILIGDIFREGFYPHAGNFFVLCGAIIVALGVIDGMIEKLRNKK